MSDTNQSAVATTENKLTPAQAEAKILADANSVSKTLKSGTVSCRPMTRKEFKEKFGLTNSDAKRMHAAHCGRFDAENKLALVAAQESGFRFVKTAMRKGKFSDRLTVTLARSSADAKETLRAQIARLQAENEVLKKASAKA